MVSSILSQGCLLLSGFLLFSKCLFSDLLLLHLVDGLDQNRLVLELVTLGGEVEVMIDVTGDLLGLSILSQKSSEDSLSSHPLNLDWHSGVSGTLSLSWTVVSSSSFGEQNSLNSGSGVHLNLSLHDKSILVELSDVLSYKQLKSMRFLYGFINPLYN